MRVLVSGAASDIGYGIGQILSRCPFVDSVIGSDVHDQYYGLDIFDEIVSLPKATCPHYITEVQTLVSGMGIDVFVPTSEAELRFFAANTGSKSAMNCKLISANQEAMEIGFNKLNTAQHLQAIGILTPGTLPINAAAEPMKLPYILKDPIGSGNSSVFLVTQAGLLNAFREIYPNYICQEYLEGQEEYTCGVYGCNNGEPRIIILKRRLAAGVTVYAEISKHEEIKALCKKVAASFNLRGSINIQLKLTPRGPMIFEINPRFSSTVSMRDLAGFSDVVWSLQEQVLGIDPDAYAQLEGPVSLYRRYSENIIFK